MKNELRRYKWFYLVLMLFLGLSSFLFLAAWPDVVYQRYLILLMVIFYFFWGIIKELKTDKLTKRIFLEYLGISILAGSLMFLVTA